MARRSETGYLDGLRGLAAFIVVLHHFAAGFFPSIIFGELALQHTRLERYVYGTPLDLLFAGNFSVCIFFVLSGFVLSYKFFHGTGEDILFSSAIRRYVRLMPTVFGAVLIAFIAMKLHLFHNLAISPDTRSTMWLGTFWNFVPSLTQAIREGVIGTFMDGTSNYDSSLWTMHFEFFGSFIVFGFLAIAGRAARRNLLYLMAALACYNTYFLAFVAGVWICDNLDGIRTFLSDKAPTSTAYLLFALGLALGSVPIASARYTFKLPLFDAASAMAFAHIVGAAALIIGIIGARSLQQALFRPVFQFLGRISFSLYLLHVIILGTFSSYLFGLFRLHHTYLVSFGAMFSVSLVLIILVSYYYTRWVDERAISASSSFYRRFGTKHQPSTVVREPVGAMEGSS